MSKFDEMMEAGRRMSGPEIQENLKGLARDPRFAAVLAWVVNNREGFVVAGAEQKIAGDHGKLAHNAGSVHALNLELAQLAGLFKGKARGGMEKPEDAEEVR
jgi:hypothetical protein